MSRFGRSLCVVAAAVWLAGAPLARQSAWAADRSDAERLLRQAIDSPEEIRRGMLLEAIQIAPEWQLPRWYLGQIQLGGRWLAVEDAQSQAREDPRLTRYAEMRHLQGQGLAGWLELARFCRQHGLEDRERLYWSAVLLAQPRNTQAIRALGLRLYQGQLLPEDQIQAWEQEASRWEEAQERWLGTLEEIRKQLEEGEPQERDLALEQLRGIDDPEAVPFLGEVFNDASESVVLETVPVLGRIETPAATMLLARCAVLSDHETVRRAAALQLKGRSYFDYVPLLMATLASPIEMKVSTSEMADGRMTTVRLEREGPTIVMASNQHYSVFSLNATQRGRNTANRGRESRRSISQTASRVAGANARMYAINARVDAVLQTVTEELTDGSPQAWWDWWQEYNDVYVPEEKPVYETEETYTEVVSTLAGCECFLAGTPVWTERGEVPIEMVQIGDRVLSQDQDTGELAYRIVLQRTVRPSAETLRVGIDGDEVVATLGHPFWVAGQGWRMARRLQTGWQLHTPNGLREIQLIEPGPTAEAYNLVVDDDHAYFVGSQGILVHDNTVRRPTRCILPGIQQP
jgi:hypothetical protein